MLNWLLAATVALSAAPEVPQAYSLKATAFDRPATLEVAGVSQETAELALSAALAEIRSIERLSHPDGSEQWGLGELNRAAGAGLVPIDPRLGELLERAKSFCDWSGGAYGPLGGHLLRLWADHGLGATDPARGGDLAIAIAGNRCELLTVAEGRRQASLDAQSRADLFGFAQGFAVDRAVVVLGHYGIDNGIVSVGPIVRAFGPGADGRGWSTAVAQLASEGNSRGALWLRDRSLAVATSGDPIGRYGPRSFAPYLHQRRGVPPDGILAVLVSTELAVDSQGLASSLFVTGSRDGQLLLGVLRPSPSIRWLLGSGRGEPLTVDYHWTEISRGRR